MTSGALSATAKVLAARSGRRLLDQPGQDAGEAGAGLGVNLEEQRRIEQFEFEDGRCPVVQRDEVHPGVGGGASRDSAAASAARAVVSWAGVGSSALISSNSHKAERGPTLGGRSGPFRTVWLNCSARKISPPSPSASTAS